MISTLLKIRHLWQLKIIIFLQRCLIHRLPFVDRKEDRVTVCKKWSRVRGPHGVRETVGDISLREATLTTSTGFINGENDS
jgi:hypothetical protein